MNIALIVCTYQRPESLCRLLRSVSSQSLMPVQVLIVDGSVDSRTEEAVKELDVQLPITYIMVPPHLRGLTRQRNHGVSMVNSNIDLVAFLDDDIELEAGYFASIAHTFMHYPQALVVEGIDLIANWYTPMQPGVKYKPRTHYCFDGWVRPEPLRYKLRKALRLMSNLPPSFVPPEGHARNGLPPSGKTYEVQTVMGGISCVRKEVFHHTGFSSFFEGYGLYEDADFSVSVCRLGKLYCCTAARVKHYHASEGRVDQYRYGKMVLRNGWYVWKRRFPNNSSSAIIKWHLITMLQMLMLLKGLGRSEVRAEFAGRVAGYASLFFSPPNIVEPNALLHT